MARGTMHAPKPDDQRRRNAPTHGETVLPRDGDGRTDPARHRSSMRPRITQVSFVESLGTHHGRCGTLATAAYSEHVRAGAVNLQHRPLFESSRQRPAHDSQWLSLRRDGSGVMCVATQ